MMSMKGYAMIAEVSTTDPGELAQWQATAVAWGLSYVATVTGRLTTLVLLCPVQEQPVEEYYDDDFDEPEPIH